MVINIFTRIREFFRIPVRFIPYPGNKIVKAVRQAFPEADIHQLDSIYHVEPYKIVKDWIVEGSRLIKTYKLDEFDCEDYTFWTRVYLVTRYKLNSAGIAIGSTPRGYHSWTIVYTSDGIYHFDVGYNVTVSWSQEVNEREKHYKPNLILI